MGGELAARITTARTTKKKKKKGRPSLLDIQKRSLKQQQLHNQNPNSIKPNRRSTRQNPNFVYNNDVGDDDDDDDDERKKKKHKLLLGLDNSSSNNRREQQHPFSSSNYSGLNSVFNGTDALMRRKKHTGSDQMREKVSKATDTLHGLPVDSGPTTPLPDKMLLVFVLDRLQKKDTYGVFSEPVNPEELPDYHEIIAHPMDFATVRKKLDGGAYVCLEQFEKDVFLICSNAMQYNAPDTIYFRQARTIHELAKKDFENLRQDSDDSEPRPQPQPQPQAKAVRRGRPPKNLKKSLETSPPDHVASEFSSDATLAHGGDNIGWSNTQNFRKGPTVSVGFRPADALNRTCNGSITSETYSSWRSEWENEFPASVVKAVLKYGKKQFIIDENKRDTYLDSATSTHDPSVLTTFEGELKQLMVVGLNTEHGYARSLARFAANLGPVVWKIASKKTESVLPIGVKFSPGWVGENKAAEQQHFPSTEKQNSSNNFISGDHPSRLMSPTTSVSNSIAGNRYSMQSGEDMETVKEGNSQNDPNCLNTTTVGGTRPTPPLQIQSKNFIHSDMNGFSGSFGYGFNYPPDVGGTVGLSTALGKSWSDNSPMASQNFGMVPDNHPAAICSMPATADYNSNARNRLCLENSSAALGSSYGSHMVMDAGMLGDSSWHGLCKQEFHPFAPDLNVRFRAPGSPGSNLQIGSPHQPDLALQL